MEFTKGASKTGSLQITLIHLFCKQFPRAPRGGLSKLEAEKPSLRETLRCILIWKDFSSCHGQREAHIGPISLTGKTRSNFWKSADVKALDAVAEPGNSAELRPGCKAQWISSDLTENHELGFRRPRPYFKSCYHPYLRL